MPHRRAMAKLTDEHRAALQMLPTSPRGYSLATMTARGIAPRMLQDLVHAGVVVAHRDAVGPSKAKVVHLRITSAGRKAIAE
jgi:hypothetical protein